MNGGGDDRAAIDNGKGMAPIRAAINEGAGAVNRIDDKDALCIQTGAGVFGFFGEPAVVRTRCSEIAAEHVIDSEISLGHRACAFGFVPDLWVAIEEVIGYATGFFSGFDEKC
jgi:hypothetical protein